MASSVVARRYAAAIFSLAGEENAVDTHADDLARAVETLGNREVLDALDNPRLDVADRVRLALDLLDGVGDHVRNLVRLLVERKRIASLPGILEQYRVLADRAAGVVHADVTVAIPADKALVTMITKALRQGFGATVRVEVHTDPAIIGGLVIRVGDRLIDNSVRTHLQQLQASLR
jgi:F-type H+-transporting ATPase subunit delta